MSKLTKFKGPYGAIAVRESEGQGAPIVLIHGNSASSRAFSRQLEGPLGARRRLIAFDLMGFGQSGRTEDAAAYLLPGQAHTLVALAGGLGLEEAIFVGWGLGGHVVLEAAPDLAHARGLCIFGTPPVAFPADLEKMFLPNATVGIAFMPEITPEMAETYVAAFFAPGFGDIPEFFAEDALKADGFARAQVVASVDPAVSRDEVKVCEALTVPLAILHGGKDALVNGDYIAALEIPKLWRGAMQVIPEAGHAPQWETPDAFDALVEGFAGECEAKR
jgi:pimeloyl-ACP methyl ester carboxylesterase